MKTPYFMISQKLLDQNVFEFQYALEQLWPNSCISYSVKTNALPWILKHLKSKGIFAEVVSDEEYQLALLAGYRDNQIIFNGPIKGESVFQRACNKEAYINLDSKRDLFFFKQYGNKNTKVGIRINIDTSIFDNKDIGYVEDGFRFGFSEKNGELKKVIDVLKSVCRNTTFGLHLHCNSITRSKNVYIAVAKYALEIIRKYNLNLSFIDIGGGFFGGVPGKTTPYEYIQAIKNVLSEVINPLKTKLIVEPGSAIIGSVISLHTVVLDIKDTKKARIVTTDGSRVQIDPLWVKTNYTYSIKQKEKTLPMKKQIICGYTCMDHDRIMILDNEPELLVNDEIIYHRVGAYSMTFGGMFIKYYPDVYVEYEDKIEKVRKEISIEEFYNIHSNVTSI